MTTEIFHRTREVIDKTSDRYRLKRTLIALETAYSEKESGLVVGLSKSLVEGLCKSLLDEYQKDYPSDIKVGKLAKKTMDVFDVCHGVENEKKAIEAFKKMINGAASHFEVAVQGIGELRNEFCPLAHGKSSHHIPLDFHYAEFLAKQADSIVGFIYDLRESYVTEKPKEAPVRDSEFDSFLDEEFESIQIYEDTYFPSEILFNVAPDIYQRAFEEHVDNLEKAG